MSRGEIDEDKLQGVPEGESMPIGSLVEGLDGPYSKSKRYDMQHLRIEGDMLHILLNKYSNNIKTMLERLKEPHLSDSDHDMIVKQIWVIEDSMKRSRSKYIEKVKTMLNCFKIQYDYDLIDDIRELEDMQRRFPEIVRQTDRLSLKNNQHDGRNYAPTITPPVESTPSYNSFLDGMGDDEKEPESEPDLETAQVVTVPPRQGGKGERLTQGSQGYAQGTRLTQGDKGSGKGAQGYAQGGKGAQRYAQGGTGGKGNSIG